MSERSGENLCIFTVFFYLFVLMFKIEALYGFHSL